MGDRNNPITFGPEWMRNTPRERSAVISASTSQSAISNPANATAASSARTSGGSTANTSSTNTSNNTNSSTGAIPKVQLAKLRYGREEMLALYDRNSEAPFELKSIESIYQPRGKQPYALNNTFEDDMRDNIRSAMPVAGMVTGERYVPHRGSNRPGDGRGKSRGYSRSTSTGKVTWHTGGHRMSNYSGGHDDDGGLLRSWNINNHHSRTSGEVSEGWPNKTYRSKRQSNTNWRQQRDEGDEWRIEPGRPRHSGDKWERDWEKSLSWNNRRSWGGGEMQNNEENLPEWAGENAECGGTFDSSGAFHGYSNDDSNIPKPDSTYPLTRSHTHTTISRFKSVEDGSDEWWASEKAKKLSPKRFDASDIKFKKPPPAIGISETMNSATTSKENNNQASSNNEKSSQELEEKQENTASAPEPPEPNATIQNEEKYAGNNVYKNKFSESKTFDAMMRSNINMDEANDERGNFQSVIITPNNSLRQKHQHLVPANDIANKMQSSKIQNTKPLLSNNVQPDNEHGIHKTPEDILVNNVLEMAIDEKEILPTKSMKSGMPSNLGSSINSLTQIQNPTMQMNMQNSVIQSNMLKMDGNINNQTMQISGIQPTGMQQSAMHQAGMQLPSMHQSGHQTSVGHTAVRLQSGKQPQGMSSSVLQASSKQSGLLNSITQTGVQNSGKQQSGMQNQGLLQVGSGMPSGMQPSGMPSSMQNRGMTSGVQNSGGMPSSMQNLGIPSNMQNPGMPSSMQNPGMPSSMLSPRIPSNMLSIGMPSSMQNIGMPLNCPGFCPRIPANKQNLGLPSSMQNPAMPISMQNTGMPSNMQNTGMPSNMQNNGMPSNMQNNGMPSNMQNNGMPSNMQNNGMPSNMQNRKLSTGSMQNSGMSSGGLQNQGMSATGLQTGRLPPPVQSSAIQSGGMAESALKASLGLPLLSGAASMGLPIQDVHQTQYPNPINIDGLRGASMQRSSNNMSGFQSNSGVSGMNNANIGNNSLFLGHNSNNPSMPSPTDIPMPPNQSAQNTMYSMHGLQHSGSQSGFGNSMYNNNAMNAADQWYYEDPKMNIQGPFSSKDMFNWYRAGFFTSSLMVRRACETVMRPLGSYGINVPFAQMDMVPLYTVYDNPPQGSHSTLMNSESGLELDVMNTPEPNSSAENVHFGSVRHIILPNLSEPPPLVMNLPESNQPVEIVQFGSVRQINLPNLTQPPPSMVMNIPEPNPQIENIQFGSVRPQNLPNLSRPPPPLVMNVPYPNIPVERVQFGSVQNMRMPNFNKPPPMVDLLWGQPSNDLMWMRNNRNEARVNNLSMFFWDQQPSAIASNSHLPEEIAKEMKTEDQILAQLRASQNTTQSPTLSFDDQSEVTTSAATKPDDLFAAAINATPNLEELHKLIQKEALIENTDTTVPDNTETQTKTENSSKPELTATESSVNKNQNSSKSLTETKSTKLKTETDKGTKNKENNNTKNKSKKSKDEKKEEAVEVKVKESEAKADVTKQPQERSPSKNKKEDKSIKKELEREKKEWIKEGFTIVKGPEKTTAKDAKKKSEDIRISDDSERKRKEAEKTIEDEKKKKQADMQKKAQEQQQIQQLQRQSESMIKKAPWSAIGNQTLQSLNREGPKLTEIQRLEREKKLEQMKEQQHMMHIIAQQQAAALAREQEVQAGLGWSTQKANISPGQSLNEIQAEARKQAVNAAVVAQISMNAQALEEAVAFPLSSTNVPWGGNLNGVGFWDTQPNQPLKSEKQQESTKPVEPVKNKKLTMPKKDTSPAAEFEAWCTSSLSPWSAKIDAPTFVAFLKDIESPYEVKDYVKCYLGDSKESNDFARQFLERRSKLLRVGMVTPSDDLCSPAIAINPRSVLNTEYQEVKNKGKKSKKNKMLKVDARILGFSVTASEDRINVGDIDTV